MVDEFGTSKVCYKCKTTDLLKADKNDPHGIDNDRFFSCPTCKKPSVSVVDQQQHNQKERRNEAMGDDGLVDRDTNGSINIVGCLVDWLFRGVRPLGLSRYDVLNGDEHCP